MPTVSRLPFLFCLITMATICTSCGTVMVNKMSAAELEVFRGKSIHEFINHVKNRDEGKAQRISSDIQNSLTFAAYDISQFCTSNSGTVTVVESSRSLGRSYSTRIPSKIMCSCESEQCQWTVDISITPTRTMDTRHFGSVTYFRVSYNGHTLREDSERLAEERKHVENIKKKSSASYGSKEKLEEDLSSWIGLHADKLVLNFGLPKSDYTLSNSTKIIEYDMSRNMNIPGQHNLVSSTTFTYDGIIPTVSKTYSMQKEPDSNVHLPCLIRFSINENGIIENWFWEGKGCRSLNIRRGDS